MPVHRVITAKGSLGWRWGNHGKIYKSKHKAVQQMKAAFANGFRQKHASKDINMELIQKIALKLRQINMRKNASFGLIKEAKKQGKKNRRAALQRAVGFTWQPENAGNVMRVLRGKDPVADPRQENPKWQPNTRFNARHPFGGKPMKQKARFKQVDGMFENTPLANQRIQQYNEAMKARHNAPKAAPPAAPGSLQDLRNRYGGRLQQLRQQQAALRDARYAQYAAGIKAQSEAPKISQETYRAAFANALDQSLKAKAQANAQTNLPVLANTNLPATTGANEEAPKRKLKDVLSGWWDKTDAAIKDHPYWANAGVGAAGVGAGLVGGYMGNDEDTLREQLKAQSDKRAKALRNYLSAVNNRGFFDRMFGSMPDPTQYFND